MKKSAGLDALVRAGLSPRALTRDQAAAYVSVSPCKFDDMVQRGLMPRAKRIGSRVVWDRMELDTYFSRLPHDDGTPGQASDSSSGDIWDRFAP